METMRLRFDDDKKGRRGMRNALRGRFFMLHSSLFVTAALLLSGCTKDEGAAQGA